MNFMDRIRDDNQSHGFNQIGKNGRGSTFKLRNHWSANSAGAGTSTAPVPARSSGAAKVAGERGYLTFDRDW